jgi:uncharacterized protein (UPF0262 family)
MNIIISEKTDFKPFRVIFDVTNDDEFQILKTIFSPLPTISEDINKVCLNFYNALRKSQKI